MKTLKKTHILSLLLLVMVQLAVGQITITGDAYYEFNLLGYMERAGCDDAGLRSIDIRYRNGRSENLFTGNQSFWPFQYTRRHTKNNPINFAEIKKRTRTRTTVGSCNSGSDRFNRFNPNTLVFNDYIFDGNEGMRTLTANSRPIVMFNRPTTPQTLGDEEYLTITLPDNLLNRHYRWRYRIGTGAARDFPASVNQRRELRIQGKDFLPDSALNQNIAVWVEMGEDAGDKLAAGIAVRDAYEARGSFCNTLSFVTCRRGSPCNKTPDTDRATCYDSLEESIKDIFDGELNYGQLENYTFENRFRTDLGYQNFIRDLYAVCNNLPRRRQICVLRGGRNDRCIRRRDESDEELNTRRQNCRNRVSNFENSAYSYIIYRNLLNVDCDELPRERIGTGRASRLENDDEYLDRVSQCKLDNIRELNTQEQLLVDINEKLRETNTNGSSTYRSFRSHTITFSYRRSAPTINNVEVLPATCFNSDNARVKVVFNRNLRSNEQIDALRLNRGTVNIVNATPITSLTAETSGGWSYTYPRDIPNGTYNINMTATLSGRTTFTGGSGHMASVTVTPPPSVNFVNNPTGTDALCFEANNGTIQIEATGGTGNNYSVDYRNGAGSWQTANFSNGTRHTLSNLAPGTYELRIKDGNNCFARTNGGTGAPEIKTVTINQPPPLTLAYLTENSRMPTGFGFRNGQIEALIRGGTPEANGRYNVTWLGLQGQPFAPQVVETGNDADGVPFSRIRLNNIPSGVYFLSVSDGNFNTATPNNSGCTLSNSRYTLEQPRRITLNVAQTRAISCHTTNSRQGNNSNAVLTATSVGGVPYVAPANGGIPYRYVWERQTTTGVWNSIPGATTAVLSNVGAGTYRVHVRDANNVAHGATDNNRQGSTPVTLTVSEPDPIRITPTVTHVNCYGEPTGEISLTLTGGTLATGDAYAIRWLGSANTAPLHSNLYADTYQVEVTDSEGCTAVTTIEVNEPLAPLEVSYGTTIRPPSALNFTDGYIEAQITGGLYPTVTNNYQFLWEDSSGQNLNSQVTVRYDAEANAQVLRLTTIGAGIYRLSVTDENQATGQRCTYQSPEQELEQPPALTVALTQITAISCNTVNATGNLDANGVLQIEATGGVPFPTGAAYEYLWYKQNAAGQWIRLNNQTNVQAINLDAGIYAANVRDANGITVGQYTNNTLITPTNAIFNLEAPMPMQIALTKRDAYCNSGDDGMVSAAITGGSPPYHILWSNGVEVANSAEVLHEITALAQDDYSVTVTDHLGCMAIAQISVYDPDPLQIDYTDYQRPSVYGASDGHIEATISGGTSFPDGSYRYQWEDATGTLLNGNVSARITPAGHYVIRLNAIPANTYRLTIEDGNYDTATAKAGCTYTNSTFTLYEPVAAEIAIEKDISCNADNTHLNPYDDGILKASVKGGVPFTTGQPYDVVWKKRNPITGQWDVLQEQTTFEATNLSAGTYAFNATDSEGTLIGRYRKDQLITLTDVVFTFDEPELLNVNISNTEADCTIGNNATATAHITGGIPPYTLAWSTGEITENIAQLKPGKYFVTVEDARGCIAEANVTIAGSKALEILLISKSNPTCIQGQDGRIEVSATGGVPPYTYIWDNGITGPGINGLAQGVHIVTVIDSDLRRNKCTFEAPFTLEDPLQIPLELGNDRTLCIGQILDVDITIDDPNASYLWTSANGFSSTNPKVSLTTAGTYTARVTNGLGCEVSDTFSISTNNQQIDAEFLLATRAETRKEIALVNVSDPKPETIDWTIPEGIEIRSSDDNLITLVFQEKGTYTIGMRAHQGDCYADFSKQIIVEDLPISAADTLEEGAFIQDVIVFPNPSSGEFKVQFRLKREAQAQLRLMSLINGEVVDKIQTTPKKDHLVAYDVDLSIGTYILIIETKFGNYIHKVLIK